MADSGAASTIFATEPRRRDALGLMRASLPELIEGLKVALDNATEIEAAEAAQFGELLVAETVRLIRLGSRDEVSAGALAVARIAVGRHARLLHAVSEDAHRLVGAAAVVLGAAAAPTSNGGELSILRSWKGNAGRLVGILLGAPDEIVARADLLRDLGVSESYLSHLLSDLEAAGLAERIRHGREVKVHLGPTARAPHVIDAVKAMGGGAIEQLRSRNAGLVTQVLQELWASGSPSEASSRNFADAINLDEAIATLSRLRSPSDHEMKLGVPISGEKAVFVPMIVRDSVTGEESHTVWQAELVDGAIGRLRSLEAVDEASQSVSAGVRNEPSFGVSKVSLGGLERRDSAPPSMSAHAPLGEWYPHEREGNLIHLRIDNSAKGPSAPTNSDESISIVGSRALTVA